MLAISILNILNKELNQQLIWIFPEKYNREKIGGF